MSDTPRISVIMPAYNVAAFLVEAVDSVLAQSFTDFEFLIIDDGSTDETAAILRRYTDPRLRVFHEPHQGVVHAINHGLQEARGQYIARMDADDICLPDRFKLQVDYLEAHPEIGLLGAYVATMDEVGRPLAPIVRFPVTHQEIWAALGRRPWVMCHPAVMFRRNLVEQIGTYNADFPGVEDAEFFARIMTRFGAHTLEQVVLRYRLRTDSESFAKKARGMAYARMVGQMIEQWKPGQPLVASAQQRAELAETIAALDRNPSRDDTDTAYQIRLGREFLRAQRWRDAARAYGIAIRRNPLNWMPYAGLACAVVRKGGTPPLMLSTGNKP